MGNWKPSLRVNVGDRYNEDAEETSYESVRAEPKLVRFENEEESKELASPFCPEDFDLIGLCCHIDADHCVQTKHGMCPICLAKGVNMVEHLITNHETFLKSISIKAVKRAESRSELAMMRKQFQDNFLHLITGPPRVSSSTPGYLSFSNVNPQRVETYDAARIRSNLPSESYSNDCSDRIQQPEVADTDKEMTKRCEFLQELVLSTFQDEI